MNYKKERVYEIKDFVFKVLNHWKAMLIVGIICAILCGALKYVKDSRAISSQMESQKNQVSVADQVKELPDTEREKIENLVSLNLSLREVSSYKENAYIMQIDPYNVAEDVLKYEISAESDDDITTIKHYYNNEVNSQKVIDHFRDILDIEDDDSSVSACINVTYNNSNAIAKDNNVLTITLKSDNDQASQQMAEIVKDRIEEISKDASSKCGKHEIKLMSESVVNGKDSEFVTIQSETDTKIFDLSNHINTLMNNLEEADKTIVEAYINEMSKEESVEKTEDVLKASISKKWLVAGFVLGIVIVLGLSGTCWLFNPKIQSVEEFRDNIALEIYGILDLRKKKGFLSDLFYKLDTRCTHIINNEVNVDLIKSQISIVAEKEGLTSLVLSGSHFEKSDRNIALLVRCLENSGLNIKLYDQFLQNAEILKEAVTSGAVVLVEEIGSSYYSEVYEEINRCKGLDIKILGSILMYH